ncbi:hypothetical protein GGR54DRAFT_586069 [Hypoxylon sp. NC1633]|nr:hypothetical protein GGR54DRAFT_586069 [Hypoxylon sp. NC1633]
MQPWGETGGEAQNNHVRRLRHRSFFCPVFFLSILSSLFLHLPLFTEREGSIYRGLHRFLPTGCIQFGVRLTCYASLFGWPCSRDGRADHFILMDLFRHFRGGIYARNHWVNFREIELLLLANIMTTTMMSI